MAQKPVHDRERIQSEITAQTLLDNKKKEDDRREKLNHSQSILRGLDNVCNGNLALDKVTRKRAVSDPSPSKKTPTENNNDYSDEDAYIGGRKGDDLYHGKNSKKRVRQGTNSSQVYNGEESFYENNSEDHYGYTCMDQDQDSGQEYEHYNPEDYNGKRNCSTVRNNNVSKFTDASVFSVLGSGFNFSKITNDAMAMSRQGFHGTSSSSALSFSQQHDLLKLTNEGMIIKRDILRLEKEERETRR